MNNKPQSPRPKTRRRRTAVALAATVITTLALAGTASATAVWVALTGPERRPSTGKHIKGGTVAEKDVKKRTLGLPFYLAERRHRNPGQEG